MYDNARELFATPHTNAKFLKIVSQQREKDLGPMPPLDLFRVRISIQNFIQKARLQVPEGGKNYVIVTVPLSILAVATRNLSLRATDVSLSHSQK